MSTAVKEDFMQDRRKKIMIFVLVGMLAFTVLSGCVGHKDELTLDEIQTEEPGLEEEDNADVSEESKEDTGGILCVFVCGQVVSPGVYELPEGSRIYQAVEAAGGMLETADATFVNQAEMIEDGQRIYLPSAEEVQAGDFETPWMETQSSNQNGSSDGRVNINTADKEELMTLTGIGEQKAQAIITYRESSGGFKTIEELMQVEGIKEGTFEKIKEDITI